MTRRVVLTALITLGVLSGLVWGSTVAYFTSSATITGNSFTSGSVTLAAGVTAGDTLAVSNLVPGDSFITTLSVQNAGTLALRYAMTTVTSGEALLASTLRLTIRTKTSNPCASEDGLVLFGPSSFNLGALGDPAQGAQVGDRALAPGTGEILCFRVELPATATAALQGKSVTSTFSFLAEQTANN
jgi:spore coat-associated protein N